MIILKTKDFTITESPFDKDNYWIQRNDGEGTEFSPEQLNELLEIFFDEVM